MIGTRAVGHVLKAIGNVSGYFMNLAWHELYKATLPWTMLIAALIAATFILVMSSRICWRLSHARKIVTFRVLFSHQSEDLPLRSEQLGNVLHALLLPSVIRFIGGQPHLTVTYESSEEKSLFVSIPDVRHFPTIVRNALVDKMHGCTVEPVDFEIPRAKVERRYGRMALLRRSSAYSLRTLKGFESDDPLEALMNSMDMGPGSTSYIQLLLKPSSDSWKRSARALREKIRTEDSADLDGLTGRTGSLHLLIKMLHWGIRVILEGLSLVLCGAGPTNNQYPSNDYRDHRRELSEETKEVVKSIDDKINCRSSFAFEIRIIVDRPGANYHDVDRIAAPFRQYDKHQSLVIRHIYWPFSRLVDYQVSNNLWPLWKKAGFLSSDELAGFLHNPYKNTVLVKVDMNTSRSAPAALQFTQGGQGRIYLGTNDHRGVREQVSIPIHDFSHHSLVIGTTGSGKSTLLKYLFLQWIASGDRDHPRGALFIEPHGDACQELLGSIPKEHIDRVYYLDPSDTAHPIAFNPLAYSSVFSADRTRDAIYAAFDAVWELDPSMANLNMYLQRVTDALARVEGAHFGWYLHFLTNKEFRNEVLTQLDDPLATSFWLNYSAKRKQLRDEETGSLLRRVDQFELDRGLRGIFCQSEARLDFKSCIDQGKILICHFGDMTAGPMGKRLLGNLFCSYVHQAAQSRARERRPFFVCIDECSEYLPPAIASILAQDRKFNIVFLAAFQYLEQAQDLLPGLKGNTNTRICFNVGEEDALALAPLFADSGDPDEVRRRADDLMNLSRYQCFLKSSVGGRPLPPTSVNLDKPLEVLNTRNSGVVKSNTIRDLCRDGDEVAREQIGFLGGRDSSPDGDEDLIQHSRKKV